MKRYAFLILLLIAAIAAGMIWKMARGEEKQPAPAVSKPMIKVTSSAFSDGGNIPAEYTCDGENASPPLGISDIPEGTRSLALIVDDPNAVSGVFNHWVLWNIDPSAPQIPENSLPSGAVTGTNSAGKTGYYGPCPPSGTHHYFFKVYALDTKLDLGSDAKKADLEKAMEGHIIGQGELRGDYLSSEQ